MCGAPRVRVTLVNKCAFPLVGARRGWERTEIEYAAPDIIGRVGRRNRSEHGGTGLQSRRAFAACSSDL